MPFFNAYTIALISVILSSLLATSSLTAAYVLHPTQTPLMQHALQPRSALASKVIYESPSIENIYKEFLVSSKPLLLRKYSGGLKAKKTKKDSKIYYIPIPPMPYRYTPGVGYDYQPVRINPILKETTVAPQLHKPDAHVSASSSISSSSSSNSLSGMLKPELQQYQQPMHSQAIKQPVKNVLGLSSTAKPFINNNSIAESRVFQVKRGNYYFNGRPFKLQVAHAQPKYQLTPQNLKSKLYFNKKIIY